MEIKKVENLSKNEETVLLKMLYSEDPLIRYYAKKMLIMHNMRLVYSIAAKYAGRGIPVEDLVQEGTIGLLKTIDRFSISKQTRFSTYAT